MPGLDFETETMAEFEPEAETEAEKAFPSFGADVEPGLEALEEVEMPAPEPAPEAEEEIAFDMPEEFGAVELTPEPPASEPEVALPPVEELPELEMPAAEELPELADLDLSEEIEKPEPKESGLPDLDFSGIDLDLSEPEEIVAQPVADEPDLDLPSEIDPGLLEEVNTKLDLARAYMEMGDKDGAREILEEALKEGDAQQKQEAEKLISSL
jgi:pilus assembly protein FimV